MKTIILSAIVICLLIGCFTSGKTSAQSAFAQLGAPHSKNPPAAYQSGYNHGLSDARQTTHWYILEPGRGFRFHTWDFTRGYVNGYCSVSGPHTGFDADEATFDCDQGPHSASWVSEK